MPKNKTNSDAKPKKDSKALSPQVEQFEDFEEVELDVDLKKLKPWRFPRLFTRRKPTKRMIEDGEDGALAFWEIGFDGLYLITRWGQMNEGARIQSSAKKIEVNKSGRTLIQQSLLNGRKKYNDKVQDGDAVTDPDLAQVPIRPTLAHPFKEADWLRAKHWVASPKIDGGRMLVFKSKRGRKLTRLTRKKKEVPPANLEHQEEETLALLDELPEGSVLDIECCLPGQTFQKFTSYFRSSEQLIGYEDVRAYVLDVILPGNDKTYRQRHKILEQAYRKAFGSCYVANENGRFYSRSILILGCIPVKNVEDVVEMHEAFLTMNYEGLMLRDADSLYQFGRSHSLLKVKKWLDDEATITDVTDGDGKMEGKAIFICEDSQGREFRVTMAATMEQREEWFQKKNSLIGKLLTYTYFEETDDGLPRFPVGIDIRDYE